MTPAIRSSAKRLEAWTREAALPFWADIQEPSGAWPEHLDPNGLPDRDAVRRHRVQARQAYTYALAHRMGWWRDADTARRTADFMWEAGWCPDGKPGLVHRLNPDASVADGRRDLYDHAFYLLALGWIEATSGGQRRRLAKLTDFIDGLAHPSGGFREGIPDSLPRRQNPHMHLFEACLNLSALGVPGDWQDRAERLVALFDTHVFDPRRGIVREMFDDNWSWDGGNVEPGHAMEWVALLDQWETSSGEDRAAARARLYQTALLQGGIWLFDCLTPEGESVRETSRLWVQTELARAHLTQARQAVAGSADMAAAAMDGLLAVWLEPRGTWRDQIGACGQTISKTIPTSTFYHIITLATEAARTASL